MGFKSKNSAYKLVKAAIQAGYIEKDKQGKLLPYKERGFPPGQAVLGVITAGFPSPAEEEVVDTLTLDEYLIENRQATYLLKVSGDSMVEAGILPGDMVLIERGSEARDGDIVIAEVDNEWTMKYFRKRGTKVFLVPANAKYPVIEPEAELKIAGVVRGVVRKY